MLVRRLARPLLAATFIATGIDTLRHPQAKAAAAAELNVESLGVGDAEQLVRATGAAQLVAGLALATNRFPRLASLLLAASVVPATATDHRFWEAPDPSTRSTEQQHFIKNVSLLGGLLLATVDTEGRESVARRTKRVSRRAAKKASKRAAAATAAQRERAERLREALPVG